MNSLLIILLINIVAFLIACYPISKIAEAVSESMYQQDLRELNRWERQNGFEMTKDVRKKK